MPPLLQPLLLPLLPLLLQPPIQSTEDQRSATALSPSGARMPKSPGLDKSMAKPLNSLFQDSTVQLLEKEGQIPIAAVSTRLRCLSYYYFKNSLPIISFSLKWRAAAFFFLFLFSLALYQCYVMCVCLCRLAFPCPHLDTTETPCASMNHHHAPPHPFADPASIHVSTHIDTADTLTRSLTHSLTLLSRI